MKFIPDQQPNAQVAAPFYEDAAKGQMAHGLKGLTTGKSHRTLKSEVEKSFSWIGGSISSFESGQLSGSPMRYGWRIHFTVSGMKGQMVLAALPLRNDTSRKQKQVLAHALFSLRDSVEAEYNLMLMNADHIPFMGYLLHDGETLADLLRKGILPALTETTERTDFVEGEVISTKEGK